jgi:hypothetical protein
MAIAVADSGRPGARGDRGNLAIWRRRRPLAIVRSSSTVIGAVSLTAGGAVLLVLASVAPAAAGASSPG